MNQSLKEKAIRIAKETLPIAHEIQIEFGPNISIAPTPILGEDDLMIRWFVKILDRDLEWQSGYIQCFVTKEGIENHPEHPLTEFHMKRVKEAYVDFRDKISHIEFFRENYRKMLSIVYGNNHHRALFQSMTSG